MGVPALFRWLSRKYPKIVLPVIEDEDEQKQANMALRNPNGQEFDALYLDMNGIVHPCTHPEGKPAPETEQDMMVEIFNYTERVVNMVRPRKLLFMAIDGVAPRAKMNQQRSRRFRAAKEAQEKEEERLAAIEEWKAMGRPVSDEFLNGKKAWDSNAITPGTPFMDLLATCLRYWVAKKMNESPGWNNLTVIISDASVPGEGEHKIMDYIRRQRVQPNYNPNTRHVIYGLDADLIMLSLATHEPHFKVLREDVFMQANKPKGCHRCGLPGHHSSMCTIPLDKIKKANEKDADPGKKPFIFLDVSILREYLECELDVPGLPFRFDFERAIDDWVFMIFFVGNDFLPHLPSLEIREGAIDVLMEIWKKRLAEMGGYLTEHGTVKLERAQFMLDGLAAREDDIFRKRRETEEHQAQGEKRRRIAADATAANSGYNTPDSQQPMGGTNYVQVQSTSRGSTASSSSANPGFLPAKPAGILMAQPASTIDHTKARADNLSAAEKLKAELKASMMASGGPSAFGPSATSTSASASSSSMTTDPAIPGLGGAPDAENGNNDAATNFLDSIDQEISSRGVKRKASEADVPYTRSEAAQEDGDSKEAVLKQTETAGEANGDEVESSEEAASDNDEDDEGNDTVEGNSVLVSAKAQAATQPAPLKKLGDNMVEQEDMVKLWEPGYKERYYQQKFGVELGDEDFRKSVVQSYMEGLCWVLAYYYQGCPSWQWYYPHHFAPFASDFQDLSSLSIDFQLGKPFQPYEQLMGVFPAASRKHIPEPFNRLMIEEDSPILDFYPEDFSIDMNGKKMLWQGVALLPFIDQKRLLDALEPRRAALSEDENRRNSIGNDSIFVHEDSPLYSIITNLYVKRLKEPTPLNPSFSKGMFGSIMPDRELVPGSTFFTPLSDISGFDDIDNDRSLASIYYFPQQIRPHKSVLLPGVQVGQRVLDNQDKEIARRGGIPHGNQSRRGDGGFHQTRRDLDGSGVRRPNRGGRGGSGYHSNGRNTPSNDPYSGYDQPRSYQQPQQYSNNSYQSQQFGGHDQPPRSYTPPAPIVSHGQSYGGYRPPQQQQQQQPYSYRPPGPPNGTHTYFPNQQPPPSSYGQPAAQNSYGGYGGYGQSRPAAPQATYSAPPYNNVAFNNAQALLRTLSSNQQQPQGQPGYYRR